MGIKKNQLIQLLEEKPGLSCNQIAKTFKVSRQAAYAFLKRHPDVAFLRSKEAGYERTIRIFRRALLEIADIGEDLEKDIAIRALEKS